MMHLPRYHLPALLLAIAALAPGTAQAQGLQAIDQADAAGQVAAVQISGDDVHVYRSAPAGAVEAAAAPTAEAASRLLAPGERLVTSEDRSRAGLVRYETTEDGRISTTLELRGDGATAGFEVAGPARFLISDDGSTVAAIQQDIHAPEDGAITLFDRSGNVLGRLEQRRLRQAHLSSDGQRLAVNTGGDGILVLSRRAEVLHRLPQASDLRLSGDGSAVAALVDGAAVVYRQGEQVARIATGGVPRDAAFADGGERVAVIDRHRLEVFDLAGGRSVYSDPQALPEGELRSVDLAADGRVVLGVLDVDRRPTRKRPGSARATVVVLSPTGTVLQRESFTPGRWNRETPAVQFFTGARDALVVSPDAVYRLQTGPAQP